MSPVGPYADVPTKPILLLDEATSAVDSETESIMRRIVNEVFTENGHTVVAITHRLGGLDKIMRPGQDMVAMLSDGRVQRVQPVDEFIAHEDK